MPCGTAVWTASLCGVAGVGLPTNPSSHSSWLCSSLTCCLLSCVASWVVSRAVVGCWPRETLLGRLVSHCSPRRPRVRLAGWARVWVDEFGRKKGTPRTAGQPDGYSDVVNHLVSKPRKPHLANSEPKFFHGQFESGTVHEHCWVQNYH